MDRFSSILPQRSTRNFTEEAIAHNFRKMLAEPHVSCQEQARNALTVQAAGFERAAQEYEQTARGEVHDAVAQPTERSRAKMLEKMGALENEAQQTCTSHPVALSGKTSEEVCSMMQRQNFKDFQKGRVKNIFKNTSNSFNATCQKFKVSKLRAAFET